MRPLCRLLAILLAVQQPVLLFAQDRPVVFVHGVLSNGTTWLDASRRLEARTRIATYRPNLNWKATIESQASSLQQLYGYLPTRPVAIGHSLGGLVSRQWTRSRTLEGVITVGTPNKGAPAASHAAEWVQFNYNLVWAMTYASGAFGRTSPGLWSWVYAAVVDALNWGSLLSREALTLFVLELGIGATSPFVTEVSVGSPFISALNDNISREAAAAPNRVAIVNTMSRYAEGGPWRLRGDDDVALGWTLTTNAAAVTLDYYALRVAAAAGPSDPASQELASALFQASWWLYNFEEFWCRTVSYPRPLYGARCNPNDGFIGTAAQYYPGSLYFESIGGPSHTRETSELDEYLYAALTNVMHVEPRTSGGGSTGGTGGGSSEPPPGSSGGAADNLKADQALYPGEQIVSSDGRYQLVYQADGNLVLYRDRTVPLWHTGTYGTSPGRTLMQADGNLVVYSGSGQALWASNTWGYPGAWLLMQSDGNLVIYSRNGSPLWATNTWGR
jgi:pimeloyl-ACP methyl ester carboxylesterase